MIIPNIWESKKWQPNHQPGIVSLPHDFLWWPDGLGMFSLDWVAWKGQLMQLEHHKWIGCWFQKIGDPKDDTSWD